MGQVGGSLEERDGLVGVLLVWYYVHGAIPDRHELRVGRRSHCECARLLLRMSRRKGGGVRMLKGGDKLPLGDQRGILRGLWVRDRRGGVERA